MRSTHLSTEVNVQSSATRVVLSAPFITELLELGGFFSAWASQADDALLETAFRTEAGGREAVRHRAVDSKPRNPRNFETIGGGRKRV